MEKGYASGRSEYARTCSLTFSLFATQGQPQIVGNLGLTGAWFPGDGFGGVDDKKITSLVNHIGRYMRGDTRRMPAVDTMVMTTDGSIENNAANRVFLLILTVITRKSEILF